MEITDPLSFFGNIVAFVVLIMKTAYDLLINPKQFRRDLDRGEDDLVAAKKKRDRGDFSTAITFLFLAISSVMMIFALVKWQ